MNLEKPRGDKLPPAAVDFLTQYFGDECADVKISESESAIIEEVIAYVKTRFGSMKYILGLALDFTILAQNLSSHDAEAKNARPTLTEQKLFNTYTMVTKVGNKTANTLSLKYGKSRKEGIRKVEEQVVSLFHELEYTGYPSACVYNTGQWPKYTDLLVLCFKLSECARLKLCRDLIHLCCSLLQKNSYYGRSKPRVSLFNLILEEYPRSDPSENGGLAFQALAYGFIATDRPHLELIASGVRTGSARQSRFGDIDCYGGPDLELSVEVKDLAIDDANYSKQLSSFAKNVANAGVLGVVIANAFSESTKKQLHRENIIPLSQVDLGNIASIWDWPKQNGAVLGMLHFLSHIEQNPTATQRLLMFMSEHDPDHDSLVYLKDVS